MNTEALIENLRQTIEMYKKQKAQQKPLFEAKQITEAMMNASVARLDGKIEGVREAIRQIQQFSITKEEA